MYGVQTRDYIIVATFKTFTQAMAYLRACIEAGERCLRIVKLTK